MRSETEFCQFLRMCPAKSCNKPIRFLNPIDVLRFCLFRNYFSYIKAMEGGNETL